MTTLDYPGQPPRVTDDAEIIATLTRKGWTVRPDPPAYDPQTHTATWSGGQWVIAPIPIIVPQEVPAYFFRRSLRGFNKLGLYRTYVAGLTDEDVKDYWETAVTIKRNSRYMPALRTALSVTPSKLDDIFVVAGIMRDD